MTVIVSLAQTASKVLAFQASRERLSRSDRQGWRVRIA